MIKLNQISIFLDIVLGCIFGVIIPFISRVIFFMFVPLIIAPLILPVLLLVWYRMNKSNFVKFLLLGSLVGFILLYGLQGFNPVDAI